MEDLVQVKCLGSKATNSQRHPHPFISFIIQQYLSSVFACASTLLEVSSPMLLLVVLSKVVRMHQCHMIEPIDDLFTSAADTFLAIRHRATLIIHVCISMRIVDWIHHPASR